MLVTHGQSDVFCPLEELMEISHPPCGNDLSTQLLLELVYWFIVDLSDGDVVAVYSGASDCRYLFSLLGSVLWLDTYSQCNMVFDWGG